ncbi:hypothetical protein CLAFUW4_11720 [Fulvia fulva]|uniref:DNA2/NAM7 helicase-like C-terminal domain-containing protein n=1 Tax=Passalora fulva TaxID=5499 RepID=A0A9Q8PEV4_PASFU|nr:uncharacterized protein CLAFUR5_10764 [Fulvia fulva]KAK4617805.1 hypothetical protein CLAFUR4_11725 [Fulvia fulva]KAK4618823.1 hypothetical protein CLAFUR0_11738 [Fulvia fulva]UJO21198.1 hypothetical protein CLAFUR5_10764 [Fulvia fulva]WPV18390.1 hypothetical protein CLAFUW4_11720 [Fulvia fulva]WPV32885.1 hypothetical protein CLAFUW7_11728 [Fulvia fulva]
MPLIGQQDLQLLVIAGDTKQLGPVVISATSRRNPHGNFLGASGLERLVALQKHLMHITAWTNYRSHPSLVVMPSALFYREQMKPADGLDWDTKLARDVLTLINGHRFRKAYRNISALSPDDRQRFVNVVSAARRDPATQSLVDVGGIVAILQLLRMLRDVGGVSLGRVGVISMYKDDVVTLRQRLEEDKMSNVDVEVTVDDEEGGSAEASTVDAFQGREKDVIIVHFVTTMPKQMGGVRHPFGFVRDPHRLNVATTRAKQVQILVGNYANWSEWCEGPKLSNGDQSLCRHMFGLMDYVETNGAIVDWAKVDYKLLARHPQYGLERQCCSTLMLSAVVAAGM